MNNPVLFHFSQTQNIYLAHFQVFELDSDIVERPQVEVSVNPGLITTSYPNKMDC